MTTAHTATPWQIAHKDRFQVCDADGEVRGCAPIAKTCGKPGEAAANAEFIVRACNAHPALVEYFNASESLQLTIGHESASADDEAKAEDRLALARHAVRAALAKAGAA